MTTDGANAADENNSVRPRLHVAIITIMPDMFGALDFGVTGRAIQKGLVHIHFYDPRDFTENIHRSIDDRPYGGGPGMVMQAPPLAKAIDAAKLQLGAHAKVIYLSPAGKVIKQSLLQKQQQEARPLILIAGRYEGVDERLIQTAVEEEWSLGDYVLSGGELACMVVVDALARLLPGALGDELSASQDSFSQPTLPLLDCPHYTRPAIYQGLPVPEVLLCGDHKAIDRYREKQSLGRTWERRSDLLSCCTLSDRQKSLLAEYIQEYPQESEHE